MTNHEAGTRVTHRTTHNTGRLTDSVVRTGLGDLDGQWHYVEWHDGGACWCHEDSLIIWTNRPNTVALCD